MLRVIQYGLSVMGLLLTSVIAWGDNCAANNKVRYLGVGTLDIHYKGFRILTDPYFTPFSMWDIATFKPYETDMQALAYALGKPNPRINAVLIGHGHYDHAGDAPALVEYLDKDATFFASKTSNNLISAKLKKSAPSLSFMSMEDNKNRDKWHYIADGWIRVKAMASEHAPQIWNINLFSGEVDNQAPLPPKKVWQWKQGINYTWMMDFLSGQNSDDVYKRIFIQTSASNYPVGVIESSEKVDYTFLAAASFDNVDDYPSGLLRQYQPSNAVFIHWENFFKPWLSNNGKHVDPIALSLIDFDELEAIAREASPRSEYIVAKPRSCFLL